MVGFRQAFSRVNSILPPVPPPSLTRQALRPATHSSRQLLQIQAILPSVIQHHYFHSSPTVTKSIATSPTMSSSTPTVTAAGACADPSVPTTPSSASLNPQITEILSFWLPDPLTEASRTRWFQGSPEMDEEISTRFGSLVSTARETSELDSWSDTPDGTVALILLLDQFPRNIYRNSALSYASDAKAQRVATAAIARGFDHAVRSVCHAAFIYMPLMHAEDLTAQIASCALFDALLRQCRSGDREASEEELKSVETNVPFGHRHRDAVLKFGRFPARNHVLGRDCTELEDEYLAENPTGF